MIDPPGRLVLLVLALAVRQWVGMPILVSGRSMVPTLGSGQLAWVNKLAYRLGEPKRGDIVVFRFPLDPQQDLIKRVIGLPGDRLAMRDGRLSINGRAIPEAYIAAAPDYSGEWVVPPGNIFVLGDNRNDSKDSHQWGLLPIENVIGKSILIYWPPPEWKIINHTREVFNGFQEQLDPIQ